jgi:hypothetical protein
MLEHKQIQTHVTQGPVETARGACVFSICTGVKVFEMALAACSW